MKVTKNFTSKKVDFLVLVLLVVAAYAYCRLTVNLYIGKGLFGGAIFTLPSVLYLSLRIAKPWKRIIISTVIFGGLLGVFFEFIQEFNHSYAVINAVFPKFLTIMPVDNVLGHIMMSLLTFTFYEHFVNKHANTYGISSRYRYALLLAVSLIGLTLALYYIHPELLRLKYSYAYLGGLAIVPAMIYVYKRPRAASELTVMVPFFFVLYMVIELVAVKHRWWIYPGQHYIGYVSLFGAPFPIEELLFWMLSYAAALISYYKIFIDRPADVIQPKASHR